MEHIIPYTLIARHFGAQCTEKEEARLSAWRAASPENEKLFQELSNEWDLLDTGLRQPTVYPDREKVWNHILKMRKTQEKVYSGSFLFRISAIAATIALVIGLSFSYLLYSGDDTDRGTLSSAFISPRGQKSQILLADGTRVWLNSGSEIICPNNYGIKSRTVELKGEAFFDVTKSKKLKFIVKTGRVEVVVHGTAFNVKSYVENNEVAVSLLRGSVEVVSSTDKKPIARLTPGERVTVSKSGKNHRIEKCDANLDGIWRLEKLRFEGAGIAEVAEKLGKWYGVNITVKDTGKFPKYWFTVKSESINDILKSMNGLHPIRYSINGNNILISSRQ